MLPRPLKELLRYLEPPAIRELRLRQILSNTHRTFSSLTVEQAFNKVYSENHWGGSPGEFCSGSGSVDGLAEKYCELISAFLIQQRLAVVVDLGCGDFRVGRKICSPSLRYIGVDIVSSLVDHLNSVFGSETVTFRHLNIVEEEPPDGDVCLVRQVLQHLSNSEILKVLRRIRKFEYAIVTEHVPVCPRQVNLDKPHGPDTRLYKGSGVFLDRPPFSLKVENLLEAPVGNNEVIRTVLIRGGPSSSSKALLR